MFETPFEENFNDPYDGYWMYYVYYYADYNGDGDYYGEDEYAGYSTGWADGDLDDWAWVLEKEEE
jgi:hypothetical protein